jgi:hypothetical protein
MRMTGPRLTAWQLRFKAVVPPKHNRVQPWDYDTELYQRRNEVERLFRRLKGLRCVFTRHEKLYVCRLCLPGLCLYRTTLCEHALKKAYAPQAHVIFAQGDPSDGVPVHTGEPGNIQPQGVDRAVGDQRLLPVGQVRAVNAAAGSGRRVAAPHPENSRTRHRRYGSPRVRAELRLHLRQTGQSEKSSPINAGK